ncbi:hypothetical protein [Sodalis sp.]
MSHRDGKSVSLATKEFAILFLLMQLAWHHIRREILHKDLFC